MASTISAGTTSGTALNFAGDTSGNLAFQTQAGVNTITIANQTGTLNAAGPTFRAYQSSTQTLSSSTNTLIQLQTENWDTAGAFNNTGSTVTLNSISVPAYAFAPPIAGYYQINASIRVGASATEIIATLYKNGSADSLGTDSNGGQYQSVVATIVYLNGTSDYIQFYGFFGTGQVTGFASSQVYFNACLLRSA
jgi:hypothetical protein